MEQTDRLQIHSTADVTHAKQLYFTLVPLNDQLCQPEEIFHLVVKYQREPHGLLLDDFGVPIVCDSYKQDS